MSTTNPTAPHRISRGGAAERAVDSAPLGGAFGAGLRRREDPRMLTGQGDFLDDVVPQGTCYARFVRSDQAHARIVSIDTSEASRQHDVVAVFTADDIDAAPIPLIRKPPVESGEPPEVHLLSSGTVRFVGEPIAVVIGTSPESARDGAELVVVDYEPLDVVPSLAAALADGAPAVHADFPDNVAFRVPVGGDASAVFDDAPVVVRAGLRNNRLAPVPLEPRGMIASWDVHRQTMDVWITTQRPHHTRWFISHVLDIPEHQLRVRAGDVGGAFGSKEPMYPDEGVIAFAARRLGRPVKWFADRSEDFLATTHGRDQYADLEVAATEDGRILGVRGRIDANMGAYLYPNSPGTVIGRTGPLLPQSYDIAAVELEIRGIYSNTTPIGPYRGAGRPEATYYMERLIELLADRLGLDAVDVRRRNFVRAFPHATATKLTYDSGDYEAALDVALEEVGFAELADGRASDGDTLVGVGVASYVEIGGVTPSSVAYLEGSPGLWEQAAITVHPTGRVDVGVGTCAHGQGHETAFAQIAADVLGLPYDDVVVHYGDTASAPFGFGTFGSRSGPVGAPLSVPPRSRSVTRPTASRPAGSVSNPTRWCTGTVGSRRERTWAVA